MVGGGGFIGRHVAAALAACGAEAHATTRGAAPGAKDHPLDLRDDDAVRALVAEVRPAITFNLAGYGVDAGERDEGEAELLNDRFVGVLAEAVASALTLRDARWPGLDLVHAGSALEYGTVEGDLHEWAQPRPTTLYGRTKLGGTRRLSRSCRELATTGLKAATARLFMVYGPGEHEGRLLPSLLLAAATRTPLKLTAGKQERDFTFVGDAAEGLLRLGVASGVRTGEVVNLATGRLTSVRAFVETAARVVGLAPELLRFGELPTRDEEMRHAPVAVARAKELLGWLPSTPIDGGVRRSASGR